MANLLCWPGEASQPLLGFPPMIDAKKSISNGGVSAPFICEGGVFGTGPVSRSLVGSVGTVRLTCDPGCSGRWSPSPAVLPQREDTFPELPFSEQTFSPVPVKAEGAEQCEKEPLAWLEHGGILTGGKNICLVLSTSCHCHHLLSSQDRIPYLGPPLSPAWPHAQENLQVSLAGPWTPRTTTSQALAQTLLRVTER